MHLIFLFSLYFILCQTQQSLIVGNSNLDFELDQLFKDLNIIGLVKLTIL